MDKKGEKLTREDILNLDYLIKSLKEAEIKLREYYDKKDSVNFNKTKRFMLTIQKKIAEDVK
tara:strand:+ start:159 stop:344 length:186 start_codon:yes stop_codon:yes gene_type:complete